MYIFCCGKKLVRQEVCFLILGYNLSLNLFIMKKIILASTLLIASIGFSQQEILQDFEANRKENPGFLNIADPFGGAWVTPTNIYGQNRFVMMLAQANGEVWQGVSFSGFSRNIDLTTDKTMTMDVYSNSAIDLAVKVIGGLDGAPSSTTDLSHTGSGWETLTANFNKGLDNTATANGVYTGLAIHLLWDSSTNNFLSPPILRRVNIDNITGVGTDPVDPVVLAGPTTDAPTPPTRLATDVISIFSDAYANINVTNFNPDWQQIGSVDADYDPTGVRLHTKVEYFQVNLVNSFYIS